MKHKQTPTNEPWSLNSGSQPWVLHLPTTYLRSVTESCNDISLNCCFSSAPYQRPQCSTSSFFTESNAPVFKLASQSLKPSHVLHFLSSFHFDSFLNNYSHCNQNESWLRLCSYLSCFMILIVSHHFILSETMRWCGLAFSEWVLKEQ